MTLNELQQQIQELLAECPEAGEMKVMQTSCLDDPYRFDTECISIGECYSVVDKDDHEDVQSDFNDEGEADNRCEDEGDWTEVLPAQKVVVIESGT